MKKFLGVLLVIILFFVFRNFLSSKPYYANDFPLTSKETLFSYLNLPQTWASNTGEMGEYSVKTLWAWPLEIAYSLGAHLGLSFEILMRIFGVFPILILSFYSIKKLLTKLHLSDEAKFLGIIFYLLNTYILLIIDGGQLQIGLSYAIFPLVYLKILNGVNFGVKEKISAGLFLCILGFLDPRFIFVLIILLFITFFYDFLFLNKKNFFQYFFSWFFCGVLSILIYVGFNFYWILPSVMAKIPTLPSTYQRVFQINFLSFANLGHALFLLQPHWYKNVFGKVTVILPEFVLIPILVFFAPILVFFGRSFERKKEVGFWLVVCLVGVFLTKGSNPPLGEVYQWLFVNVPGFSLFRDSTKFFFLVALSYSVLLGITSEEFIKRFNWKLRIVKWKLTYFFILLAFYFLILIRPVWLGKMTGTFSPPVYQDEYKKVNKILEEDRSFGKVFWIPIRSPLGYSSPIHPSVEAQRFISKRPFEVGIVGSYELFNFLRDAPFTGELFDIFGIKYIVYPYPDTRREELKKDNIDYYFMFLEQLTNLPWIELRISNPPVSLLKVKGQKDRFFIAENILLVVGSDRIYNELLDSKDFKLNKNALIFAEKEPGFGRLCESIPCRVLLYQKDTLDLVVDFVDKKNFVYPSSLLDFDPDETGWWKRETYDFLWFRNFLQKKYGVDNQDFDYSGGYAVSEGNNQIVISNNEFVKGNILLARVMQSSKGGKVEFFQENQKIGEVNTKVNNPKRVKIKLTGYKDIPDKISIFDDSYFKWFEIGNFVSNAPLTIKTSGEINVVNALVAIEGNEWKRINELIHEIKVIKWGDLSDTEKTEIFSGDFNAKVSYKQISPTHYRLEIKGLVSPATLVFSENYDPLWTITNLETGERSYAFPLYSLVNGFYIVKDGWYDIYFEPQKYVLPGLFISGFTLSSVVIFLVFLEKKKKS